MKNKRT